MFSTDKFIEDCIKAVTEGEEAVNEVVSQAMSDRTTIISALGKQEHAGIHLLFRSPSLTIINFTWAPYMNLMPHNHQMFSVVGIYSGREDNIFWQRTKTGIEASKAMSLGAGDVCVLDKTAIHSVLNPIGKRTGAIHVYGGNFFAPHEPRSEWDHETLLERPWDVERVKSIFQEAEERFTCSRH
ncbi:hypothetical protein [Vibrio ziniensis]|uniref:Metal-dependent protein of the double-stranded beta helix superfamily-like protein n=1 Tax=Vibrio ziniensis TaxID=2711221 RepID=A0A6G7CHT2_9VIBR|nr:hypothetical protein [Vibrio ziniensis]QIH41667.1 hypothetical protein G5S32_06565 [Vibrio ziniensis]